MRRLLVVALALFAVGCSKCGKGTSTSAAGIERVMPAKAGGLVVVPNLHALGERLAGLQNLKVAAFAAQLNGFKDAHEWADALVLQLGIDVRSKDALEKAGLDPVGAAGAFGLVDGSNFLVVPVKDEVKLVAVLQKLAAARLGAGVAQDTKQGDVTVHGFAAAAGNPSRLAWIRAEGFAIIAVDESVPKLGQWSKLAEPESLSKDATYTASIDRLPKDRDLVLRLPAGSPALRGPVSAVTAALALRPEAITLTADAAWSGDPKALALLLKQSGPDLLGYLPGDAWLVAKFAGDPMLLGPWIEKVEPNLKQAFTEAGFDVDAEVLANLKAGSLAGLSLAPNVKMTGMPELDLRSTNPFNYVHLSGATQVKDAAKAGATLEKFTVLAPKLGSQMAKSDRNGQPVYLTSYAAGEGVHFAAKGSNVFFASPAARLDALLASDGKATPVAKPALKEVLDGRALTVVVDLQKLAAAVRELPSAAWGIGGFAIKATTLRWLDATADLEAITAGLESKQGSIQAQLVLALTPPAQ